MGLEILGLGTARPRYSISQEDAVEVAAELSCERPRQRRVLETIYRQSQVRRRASVAASANGNGSGRGEAGFCYPAREGEDDRGPGVERRMRAYEDHAAPLAQQAAERALAEAGVEPGEVGQLVVVSCTGFAAPGVDVRLIKALGLPADVGRTMIGFMGCHGAINGLRVGQALAESRPGSVVLVCAVELCSLHFQYGWETQRVVANALFADGAGAVVGRAGEGSEASAPLKWSGRGERWTLRGTGSVLVPGSGEAMGWRIGDHGFEMRLSPEVPGLIREHLRPWVVEWLRSYGLGLEEVGSWAIHPGGPRVVDAVEASLGLASGAGDASRAVLGECGNMSSPTVLFIAERLRRAGAKLPCVMLAFGPGLVVEGAVLGEES